MEVKIKTFLVGSVPFGLITGLFYGAIANSALIGVKIGLINGVIFGFLLMVGFAAFAHFQSKKFKKNTPEIVMGKDIVLDGPANHFMGGESVGGWIYLTREELIFKSHNFNIQIHELKISLNQIKEIKPILTLGFIPNGLQITTKTEIEKFVVNKRKDWIEKINKALMEKDRVQE